jgi:TP901 family phage tail tape measure protein
MSEYMVDVGLNVNAGSYMTSMGQAVAVTRQYSEVVDGIPAVATKMTSALVGAANKITGFNAVNTLAVDTAASYQKALSGIEAGAAASGRSFTALEKTTKQFGRNFSGGMGQAVQVVETLQKQGIKSEKQIDSLGKAWIKLGAATGSNAAQIGADFTQLSRSMGNGISQFTKLSDSLVTTTAKIGGSADSVVSFSKALAPVAATIGINQTAVMGLSAAMSSLGEDGYRSANVLNKVMLDMNRAVRDGGPELKAYADVMGTTSEKLRDLMKQDPTEFMTRFAESLGKAGPQMSRQLEMLGFDSVRDTRSLAALTRSGNLREAIDTAQKSYGDGSTERAASKALEGVTDQADKLKESMTQVVVNMGRPLLGVASNQLGVANTIAGGIAGATEGKVPQVLTGVAGAAGAAGSIGMNALTLASFYALSKIVGRKLGESDTVQEGRRALVQRSQGLPVATAPTALGRFGQVIGGAVGSTLMTPSGVPMTAGERFASGARTLVRTGAGVAAFGLNSTYGNLFRNAQGLDPIRGVAYNDFRDSVKSAGAQFKAGDMRGALQTVAMSGGRSLGSLADPSQRVTLPQAIGSTAVGAGRMALGAAGLAASSIGRVATSIMNPYMMGILAAAGTGMYAAGKIKESDARVQQVATAGQDLNSTFNSFAAAMGMASRGLESFSATALKSAGDVAKANTTNREATTIDPNEVAASNVAGYEPQKRSDRAEGTNLAAGTAIATLGFSAKPEEIAAYVNDLASSKSLGKFEAQNVADVLREVYGDGNSRPNTEMGYSLMQEAVRANGGTVLGLNGRVTEPQAEIGVGMTQAAQAQANSAGRLFGGEVSVYSPKDGSKLSATYGDVVAVSEAKQLYDAAYAQQLDGEGDKSAAAITGQAVSDLIGINEVDAYNAGLPTQATSRGAQYALLKENRQTFEEVMARAAEGGNTNAARALALINEGYVTESGANYSKFSPTTPDNEKAARALDKSFVLTSKAAGRLSDSLYEAEAAGRALKKPMEELTALDVNGMSAAGRDINKYRMDRSDTSRRDAGLSVLDAALANSSGSQGVAAVSIRLQQAMATNDDLKNVLGSALALQEPRKAAQEAGRTQMQALRSSASSAYSTYGMQYTPTNSELNDILAAQEAGRYQWQEVTRSDAMGINRSAGAMQTSINAMQRQTGVTIGMINRDTATGERYAREDFARQQDLSRFERDKTIMRSNRDFGTQRTRATVEYNKQEQYSTEDKELQEFRANRDFTRQMSQSDDDYRKSKFRADEDFNTQRLRAQRDFDKQMFRGQRDFDKGSLRGQEDFDRARVRATEDFNKQIARMVEDSAKQMYDPWKRISAQMVMDAGQLVTNLKDQTAAVDRQVSNLAEARSLGLSDAAIKALNLSDASNAQQLSRIVEDIRGNGSFSTQINNAAGAKALSSGVLAQDQGNVSFARAQEDFATQMKRGSEDFNTSKSRALTDFEQSKSDTNADFKQSLDDSQADFNKNMVRMDADFAVSVVRANLAFDTSMGDMQQSFNISRARAKEMFTQQLAYSKADHDLALSDLNKDFNHASQVAADSLELSVKRMWERARTSIADAGAAASAQIKSMMEQFYQVGQSSAAGDGGITQMLSDAMKNGIDPKTMGEDWQARIQNSLDYIKTNNIKVPKALTDFYAGKGFTGKDLKPDLPTVREAEGEAAPRRQYDESDKAGLHNRVSVDTSPISIWKVLGNPGGEDLQKKWKELGVAAAQGFAQGFTGSADDESLGLQMIRGFIQAVKNIFGIQSPSKVFKEIGENVVQGLKDGITGTIGGVWEKITDPIKDLDIGGKVTAAFETAKTYLSTLSGKITAWVSSAWDSITRPLASIDIEKAVKDAFSKAKEWIGGLGDKTDGAADSVSKWIGSAWDGIMSGIPTIEKVLGKVQAAFGLGDAKGGGIAQWLQGLKEAAKDGKDTVTGWIGDAWGKILTGIPDLEMVKDAFRPLVRGIVDVVNSVISAWNAIKITFEIPAIARGKFGIPDQPSFALGTKSADPVKYPFALGGIATRQTNAIIGEAGYPEAVIPLNQRGAEVLAATMARYVDRTSVQTSMVSQYATPVINNYSSQSFDQSTQFTGPITVKAQSPDEMAQALQARARRKALSQPIQGRR